ncbi:hypothetical protein GZ77_17255 [Endozoicomonas montiporae]|uniref:L-lysine 2,3-aminomutase n=1 Tax=Endozoicomonas montiporae TaxID=1027273 RepID=A0A081N1I6_9GAMM|nr:hypothetical protein GZ77_17255 [Endozoicomonas montiporae]
MHTGNQQTRSESWQMQLANCVTRPEALLEILGLAPTLLPAALDASKTFAMRIPRSFIARMEYGNPNDPLLRQVLPVGQELTDVAGFGLDPLGEKDKNPTEGIIHKYRGRLLLITSGACAVNCRFCFRRHFPYQDNQLSGQHLQRALDYIKSDSSIREVILSGGDPLAASDRRLQQLTSDLAGISHVKTLRIHSRLPVVLPDRVSDDMLHWLRSTRLKTVVVLHCNHANEIDDSVKAAINRLKMAGATLLNQAVLLKGINDSVDAQVTLSEKLFDAGVLPYYLHVLDKVQGAAHFDISEESAQILIRGMMEECAGYLVPKLVRDIPGKASKTIIPVS